MSRWFRSEPMEYASLILNEDAARATMTELGALGVISFTDLNPGERQHPRNAAPMLPQCHPSAPSIPLFTQSPVSRVSLTLLSELTPFQRRYVSYVKRCDELERKLRFFGGECAKFGLPIAQPADAQDFANATDKRSGSALLGALETELEGYEAQLKQLNGFNEKLTSEYNEKIELHECLLKAREFFSTDGARMLETDMMRSDSASSRSIGSRGTESLLAGEVGASELGVNPNEMRFSSVVGVVASEEKARFERMIFRSTRGNCFLRFAEIEQAVIDPETNQETPKHVFICFYKSSAIETKLRKICDAFSAHRYSLPDMNDDHAVSKMLADNAGELSDSHTVLTKNQDTRYRLCQLLASHVQVRRRSQRSERTPEPHLVCVIY